MTITSTSTSTITDSDLEEIRALGEEYRNILSNQDSVTGDQIINFVLRLKKYDFDSVDAIGRTTEDSLNALEAFILGWGIQKDHALFNGLREGEDLAFALAQISSFGN